MVFNKVNKKKLLLSTFFINVDSRYFCKYTKKINFLYFYKKNIKVYKIKS